MNLETQIPDGNGHLTIQNITDWLSGGETANLQIEYEQHCVRCAECRERVAMIRQAMQPDEEMVRSTEFQEMLRISERVAMRVWEKQHPSADKVVEPEPEPSAPSPEEKSWLERLIPAWRPTPSSSPSVAMSGQSALIFQVWQQPAFRLATAAILLIAAAIPGYWYWQQNQPVNRSMASLRQAWTRNRPIETRVTGDFPYLPYMVTRGSDDKASVNQTQLLAATADLAREVADHPTPRAKHALGRLHLLKEEFDKAEPLLKEVIAEEPQNALAHVDLASVYYERGVQADNLLILVQAAEHLAKATEISPKLAEAWFNLALCHERMILPDHAQADWKKYLELDSSSPWAAEARAHLERLANPNKSFVAPDRLAEDLLAAAASNDQEKFRQLVLNNFITAFNLGREDFLDKYLEARTAEDQVAAAKYLDVMRRTARLAREEKTEHYLNDLVAFVATAKQPVVGKVVEIRALLRQGDQSHERGKYDEANLSYEKAVVLADWISDVCHSEQARYGLARINIHKIETPERQRLREELVRETGRRNHKVLFARSLLPLANAYGAAQLLTKSLQADITAYQVAWLLGDFDAAVNGLRFSGRAYVNLGDYENAILRNFQAIQTLNEHPVALLRECQSYVQIAEALEKASYPALALAYQQEALKFCSKTGNLSLLIAAKGGLGLYHTLLGQYRQAAELFQESLSELEKYDDRSGQDLLTTELSILLGDSYIQQTRNEDAAEMYQKALNSVNGTKQLKYLVMARQGLATAFLRQGRNEEAEKELLVSVALAEKIRKNINDATQRGSFRGRRLGIYRTMTEFQFVARNNLEKAFYYAELSRNRELFDAITTQSEIRWDSNQATLEYAASGEILDLRRIQSILPDNTQLVEYAITDRHLLVWLVTNSFWKSYSIPVSDQQLRQLCAEYLAELQSVRNAEALRDKAADLHSKLIKPLAGDLDPNRILVIVPDGILGAIPFPALFSAESHRYLIQDYAVATIPSAGILANTLKIKQTKNGKQPESLLVLSNPKLDAKQFPSLKALPATERESAGIGARYATTLSLSREQATKSMLLRNIDRYSVIHLATHSIVNEQNPLLSSVILSPNRESPGAAIEGSLRAFEIFGLRLTRPRLVILSSCRSGLNAQSVSNGLGGLAHAFFKAGVPAVIGSLWEVEDQSAAELMKSVHYFHRVEKQPFCQALRSAQLQMLNRQESPWKHPYYWAAFQFSGNGFTS